MMIQGYSSEIAQEVEFQHDISMKFGEESDTDFFPSSWETNEHGAPIVRQGNTDILELLVDGPCIAFTGYILALELWEQYK